MLGWLLSALFYFMPMITYLKIFFLTLALSLCLYSPLQAKQWTAAMDSLATQTENTYSLPHGICRSFALQESGYDSTATRIESTYFNQGSKTDIMITNYAAHFLNSHPEFDNTLTLEKAQLSISFGLFQILGINYRALGYDKENINPTLKEQFDYFGKFVQKEWQKIKNVGKLASWFNSGTVKNNNSRYARNVVTYWELFKKVP
jgi:hypothetical protein